MKNSPLVYSYRRVSSGKQTQGHSLDRQTSKARSWCVERGLTLDESLSIADLGISAFSGKNAVDGALSGFLAAAKIGKIPPGSILLLESLDRLSRSAISDAVTLLMSIVKCDVRVVSMLDGKEWNQETINDTVNFLLSVLLFSRAHEESATKSKRVRAAFQKKRSLNLPVIASLHGPGWCTPAPDKSCWLLDELKADSVRKVFHLAIAGHGGLLIAKTANLEKWTFPLRLKINTKNKWSHTTISRLLRDRRVLGEYQPKRLVDDNLVFDGEPVLNYFPSVIDSDTWYKVQNSLNSRIGPVRIRGSKSDIFGGLFFCNCGGKMERKAGSLKSIPRYYCLNHKAGLSQCISVAERVLIDHGIRWLVTAHPEAFSTDFIAQDTRDLFAVADTKYKEINSKIDKLIDTLQDVGKSSALVLRLSGHEKERDLLLLEMEKHKAVLSSISSMSPTFGVDFADEALAAASDKSAFEQRHKIYNSLSQVLDKIILRFPYIDYRLKNGVAIYTKIPDSALKRAKRK